MNNLSEHENEIQAGRESVYGPWRANMFGTSKQMQGLWTNYIATRGGNPKLPAWWAPLMMVAVKLNRIASGNYVKDNFDDLRVYLAFVEEMQKQEADNENTD